MNKFNYLKSLFALVVAFSCAIMFSPPPNIEAQALGPPGLDSKAYCLVEAGSGQVLLEQNSLEHLPIASVTKTMTLLLTFEAMEKGQFTPQDMLLSSENASGMGGSQVFLEPNTKYKVEDLLYAVVMSSANDASVVFAEAIGGSEQGFVDMMNAKAKSMGLKNTHFSNCTGLPANDHYSCASDVACIMKELSRHTQYFDYTKERLRDFVHPTGRITQMTNTNKLVRSYNGCDAGKTGSTVEAGYCLSATAMRNNMRLICVVLGAKNSKQRFSDCANILDYGFANYESKCLVDKNQPILCSNTIAHAKNQEIYAHPQDSYYYVSKKGEEHNLSISTQYYDVNAPMAVGKCIGQIIVMQDDNVLQQINLVLDQDVQRKTLFDEVKGILSEW